MGTENTSSSRFKYDVFLSFRGQQTPSSTSAKFIRHLTDALVDKRLRVFEDDTELNSPRQLLKAIKESDISLAVLSKEFESLNWGVNELAQILKVKDATKVIPIFYDVDPSHIRNQTGKFGEQFKKTVEKHKSEPEKVERWTAALTEVANLSGWNSKDFRSEADLINAIVEDVWRRVRPGLPFPSSLDSAVNNMPSTPSCSCLHQRKEYCELFISFRGLDTRYGFFNHVYKALDDLGISTFRDDRNLERGKKIDSELEKAIKEAKICLAILSPNFASSRWCLDELCACLHSTGEEASVVENTNGLPTTLRDAAACSCNTRDSCESTKLGVLVNYDRKCAKSGYVGVKTKGLFISKDITYEELVDRAYHIVGVDPREYKITIKARYESKDPTEAVEITDDDDLKIFILENLVVDAGSRLPLCITAEPLKSDPNREGHYCRKLKQTLRTLVSRL